MYDERHTRVKRNGRDARSLICVRQLNGMSTEVEDPYQKINVENPLQLEHHREWLYEQ